MERRNFSIFSNIKVIALSTIIVWTLIQLYLVLTYWNIEQVFDAQYYINEAIRHEQLGLPYPTIHNLYDKYIQSPGYINMLAIIYCAYGNYHIMQLLNILFNVGIVINIFYLAKLFFDIRTAYISVIIYCIIPSNAFIPIWLVTELPYLFWGTTALNLSVKRNCICIILAGVLYAYSQMIRPITISFVLCSIMYYIINKSSVLQFLKLLIPYFIILTILPIIICSFLLLLLLPLFAQHLNLH